MKRRTSDADPRNPLKPWDQAHARRSFPPFRSSGSLPSRGNKDTGCRKRVKFTDLSDDPVSCRRHEKSIPSQGTHTTISGDPKTSEYAFFKQLKENAGHRFDSHSKDKEGNQSDKLRSSSCSRKRASVENNSAQLRTSLDVENRPSVNSDSFFSPVVSASKNSEVSLKNASTMIGNVGTMLENMDGIINTSKHSRTENRHADTYSRKRQKLRQWVIGTSFPEINELCSNGYNIVSVLLSRLIPKNNDDNSVKPPKSAQFDVDARPKLAASSESDIRSKKLYQITGNSMEVDRGQFFSDELSSYWSDRSRETALSDYDSPMFHAYKAYRDRLGRRATLSWTETNSDSDFSFEKYNSFPLCHIEEQHEFHNQNGYLLRREPEPLLLGWDSDMTKETNFSNNCQNLELITYPPSLTLWDDHHQRRPNDGDAASWLSTSSNYCSEFYPCLPTQSATSHSHDFGGHILEENENMVAESNHFPLTLLNRPGYLGLNEHFNYNNTCQSSSISTYPQNHNWLASGVVPDRYYPDTKASLFSSGYDINSVQKCLSLTGAASSREFFSSKSDGLQFPHMEGLSSLFLTEGKCEGFLDDSVHKEAANHHSSILDIRDLPTFCFQASLNREIVCPLLLDKPSWDDFQGKELINDGELEHF